MDVGQPPEEIDTDPINGFGKDRPGDDAPDTPGDVDLPEGPGLEALDLNSNPIAPPGFGRDRKGD
jgi:hypothetical protein